MRFHPLNKGFGVEVSGVDILRVSSAQEIDDLRAAFDEYQLLLFHCGERISPDRQVQISSWFGPPVSNSDGALWSVLKNEEAAGSIRLPFHSDFSYTDSPIKGISLHAVEIPPSGTSTSFASGAYAWATLAPERQQMLMTATLRHHHTSEIGRGWPDFVADHPLRLLHPRTGKPVLYVTEHHAHRILEMDPATSKRLLGELFEHIYAPGNIYVHRWRHFDLVIWDNLAVQHARTEKADISRGHRVMQRVALNDVAFPELLERARQQERESSLRVR
jgi:taurine dioxygenase